MKTFNKTLMGAGMLLALSLASCDITNIKDKPFDLTTETQSSFDESIVFSNYALAENSIYGIYTVFGQTNGHRGRYCPWYGFNTDIECYGSTTYDGKNLDIAAYNCLPGNSNLNVNNDPYASIYTAIERANLCVSGLRKYANEETMPLLGEALTARALLYTELLKAYGEVPARFEPVGPATIYLNKSDKDVIYKQLLADLDEAIPLLPWPAQTAHAGRMNRAFAEGLYARLALYASGYSLRPAEGKVGTGDPGSIRLTNDAELQKSVLYPKALEYLKDCISNSGVSLYADYKELWTNFNNMDMTPGKEVLYALPFNDARGRWNYTFAIRAEANTSLAAGSSARGGSAGPLPTVYYMYDGNDVRRDLSCVNYKWVSSNGKDVQELAGAMNWYFGKYRFEWMTKAPYTGGNDDGIKPVYMRFSDVLLMAAEIANELGEINYAKEQLLKVRSRAFKGHETEAQEYVASLSQGDSFFQAIVNERALEFVGEFLRKADLIRWNMLGAKLDEAKAEIQQMADRTGKYAKLPDYVYTKMNADGQTLSIYGLNLGETSDPGADWAPYTDSQGKITEYFGKTEDGVTPTSVVNRIASIYMEGVDPEARMWWPINSTNITNGMGYLANDYGY